MREFDEIVRAQRLMFDAVEDAIRCSVADDDMQPALDRLMDALAESDAPRADLVAMSACAQVADLVERIAGVQRGDPVQLLRDLRADMTIAEMAFGVEHADEDDDEGPVAP